MIHRFSRHPARALQALVAALVLGCTTSACDKGADAPEVVASFDALTAALKSRDAAAIWRLTDTATQTELLALTRRVLEARTTVETLWGDLRGAEASRASAALALDTFTAAGDDDDGRGARLVEAFIPFDKLSWTPGSEEALKHPTVVIDDAAPGRAIVRVPSGESFVFERDGDRWASTLVRVTTLESPRFKGIAANLDKLSAYNDEAARQWRTSLDATKPQGAYNLLRRAVASGTDVGASLFNMIDDDTRAVFVEALETGRRVQKRIQQRNPKAQRAALYDAAGIAMTVGATSDQALFVAWYATKPLPESVATDVPLRFTAGPRVDGEVRVGELETESGRKWPMTRRDDGIWTIAAFNADATTSVLAPMKKAEAEAEAQPPR